MVSNIWLTILHFSFKKEKLENKELCIKSKIA